MPFYYRKNKEGLFDFELAGSKKGWSMSALKWLNFMSYNKKFAKSNGEFYPLYCCLTGEREISVKNHTYS